MKFVLAFYGTRGDVEPGVAVGLELVSRGHDVQMVVSPDLVDFVESAGLAAVAYGVDGQTAQAKDFGANVFKDFPHNLRVTDLIRAWRDYWEFVSQSWVDMTATLMSVTDGADLLFTGLLFEDGAANVAERFRIPLACLHYLPVRANGQVLTALPPRLARVSMTGFWWLSRAVFGRLEVAQRRRLGLPKARGPAPQRITKRGALEIQAYDELYFPGLAAEWARWRGQRPFVGALTMESPTDADEEVLSWIAAGTPPICFAFGSMLMDSPAEMIEMIGAACAQLGERALLCAGATDFTGVPQSEHVKVVGKVNYAAVFPTCRAVVHHGGAGTVAAGLRAGVPTLVLWSAPDRQMWGAMIKRLEVGSTLRLSSTTRDSLIAELRRIVAPQCVARAREVATQMSKPAEAVSATADLVEDFARSRRVR